MLNTTGTKKSVETVAKIRPPITARPSGAFCSPPSPRPSASQHADHHGERRHQHRAQAHVSGLERGLRRVAELVSFSRAKLITSTLFAVATPMHMIAPVSAGTDSVVCVANSIQTMPARPPAAR